MNFTEREREEIVRMAGGLSCAQSVSETCTSYSSVRARRRRVAWKLRMYWRAHVPEELVPVLIEPSIAILGEAYAAARERGETEVPWMTLLARYRGSLRLRWNAGGDERAP